MPSKSKIEWTESTWNPVTGCSKVSAGCQNCYAERLARRLHAMGNVRYRNGFDVTLQPDLLKYPETLRQPHVIFVNSMSDLFHEDVPEIFIQKVFQTMKHCSRHTFQVLTKRSERLAEMAPRLPWPDNVWMGVSVEDQRVIDRIRHLSTVPAAIRFISCEPLIGQIDELPLDKIHWVIVGGESGPGARPMNPEWVQLIREQCENQKVPFFFKQWGGTRKHDTGRTLNDRTYDEMPSLATQSGSIRAAI
jgi:protein gp37